MFCIVILQCFTNFTTSHEPCFHLNVCKFCAEYYDTSLNAQVDHICQCCTSRWRNFSSLQHKAAKCNVVWNLLIQCNSDQTSSTKIPPTMDCGVTSMPPSPWNSWGSSTVAIDVYDYSLRLWNYHSWANSDRQSKSPNQLFYYPSGFAIHQTCFSIKSLELSEPQPDRKRGVKLR